MVNAAVYSAQQLELFGEYERPRGGDPRAISFGRTSPEHSAVTKGLILEPYLRKSDRPKFQYLMAGNGHAQGWLNAMSVKSRGASSTLNIGECPSVAVESFLSRILQTMTDVPEKYYLSAKACRGILRRAQERGKELPEELRIALERQAVYMDLTHGQV
jgi:hypothetical protein